MRRSFQKPSPAAAVSNVGSKCQKCLKEGHWTADCTNERVYKARPSRTALLFNPKLKLPEASLVKDDFVDERAKKSANDTQEEFTDADTFADQLIQEVKHSRVLQKEDVEEEEGEYRIRSDQRYRERFTERADTRSRSISRSPRDRRSHERSPRDRRSRSPLRTLRNRSRSPQPQIKQEHRKEEKKYTEYASDSDFSSDSD